jgi:hypothetical protein
LGKTVREPNLEDVADLALEHRTRNLAVIAPGPRSGPRYELPIDFARIELDRNYLAAGIGLGRGIGAPIGVVSTRRWLVRNGAVMMMNTVMVVMRLHTKALP